MIQIREDLMNTIKNIFKEKYNLKDSEKAEFLELDYPEFNLEMEIFSFKVDQDRTGKSIEQCVGEIYSPPSNQILYLCNGEEYKKYEDNEKKFMNKSKSGARIKSYFEFNKLRELHVLLKKVYFRIWICHIFIQRLQATLRELFTVLRELLRIV